MVAHHQSATPEHYTPAEIIEAARAVMGGIDLDPASTQSVNDLRVRAHAFFDRGSDGLTKFWYGRAWLNPPGGKLKKTGGNVWGYAPIKDGPGESSAAVWWRKLAEEYVAGRVTQAIFLGFTLEIFASSQSAAVWPGDLPFCIPAKRIRFEKETAPGTFVKGDSPTHSNVIVYLPPRDGSADSVDAPRRFAEAFSKFGRVSYRRTVDRQLPLAIDG